MNARNIWWLISKQRRTRALGVHRATINCQHSRLGQCYLRIRPGDTRKSCWAQCLNCGTYVACNC